MSTRLIKSLDIPRQNNILELETLKQMKYQQTSAAAKPTNSNQFQSFVNSIFSFRKDYILSLSLMMQYDSFQTSHQLGDYAQISFLTKSLI